LTKIVTKVRGEEEVKIMKDFVDRLANVNFVILIFGPIGFGCFSFYRAGPDHIRNTVMVAVGIAVALLFSLIILNIISSLLTPKNEDEAEGD
jgi:uncharacterized BrkB/YihY/UPF0761 family membrane protein